MQAWVLDEPHVPHLPRLGSAWRRAARKPAHLRGQPGGHAWETRRFAGPRIQVRPKSRATGRHTHPWYGARIDDAEGACWCDPACAPRGPREDWALSLNQPVCDCRDHPGFAEFDLFTLRRVNADHHRRSAGKQVSTVGRPIPRVEIKIVDPVTGAVAERGIPGEQRIRGYNVMLGYWNTKPRREPQSTQPAGCTPATWR
jgi:hypothetical protein